MSFASDAADAAAEAFAEMAESVTVNAVAKNAIVSDLSSDEVVIHGGESNKGGMRVACQKADFASAPEDLQVVVARGRTMSILSVENTLALYILICGEPEA